MQNKFRYTEPSAAIAWDQATLNNFRSSKFDELIIQTTEIHRPSSGAQGTFEVDTFVIPLNLGNFVSGPNTILSVERNLERQDAKRQSLKRLPQAVLGCGLVIFSATDSFESYFINSFLMPMRGGFLRWGLCNFTATEANNPLVESDIASRQFLFSFFDLNN